MKWNWLARQGADRLLVFWNGWGMDERPFAPLLAEGIDVLVLSDFTKVSGQDRRDILLEMGPVEHYRERVLLAWSMGVWAAHTLFNGYSTIFQRKIAVNGTLCPIHDSYGISRKIFSATALNWSDPARKKFYRRMCGEKQLTDRFTANEPARSVEDQRQELDWYLDSVSCSLAEESFFDEAWVSRKDKIMVTENQLNFWGSDVQLLDGGHFPFYQKQSWSELLQLPNK
ncbi:DUF452 family protein [Desulfosediminicola sp.]|uniref:DUF452 family protein n=1 Tax=Desulfosediminicola sp. TaxID=2886825 RepID=UPI003AF2C961